MSLHEQKEVKVVFIGESGSGKSTIIRHLAKNPDMIKAASSKEGHAGTTKLTVEYIYGDFEEIQVVSVLCNEKLIKGTKLEAFLLDIEEFRNLDKKSEIYENELNSYVKQYLMNLSIEELFNEINGTNLYSIISLNVPVNTELLINMKKYDIDYLKIADTRGLGDNDDIERVIPFAGADAIIIIGKNTPPNPSILDGLVKVCSTYSYIPVLFVGTHSINEDEVSISSHSTDKEYLEELNKYNKLQATPIRQLYANVCEMHSTVIEPVKKVMNECRINHVPYIRSLAIEAKTSNYYKYYIPACNNVFENCIKTISSYQIAQREVSNNLLKGNEKNSLYISLNNDVILPQILRVEIIPMYYKEYIDFVSVAKGVSLRKTPLDYSYNCVAATLHTMLRVSIDEAKFSGNYISNDIMKFFLKRVLAHNSYNWYWGYDTGYYYSIIDFCQRVTALSKQHLGKKGLELSNINCTRFGKKYNSEVSIQIFLYEEALKYLLKKIDEDIDVSDYKDSINDLYK